MRPTTERYEQIEKRSRTAFIILATMTVGASIVCGFGQWIPEPLLVSAATTMLCSGAGVACAVLIQMDNVIRRLWSM